MKSKAGCLALLVVAGWLASDPAVAASGSCRASAVRMSPAGLSSEPLVANRAAVPCVAESKTAATVPTSGDQWGMRVETGLSWRGGNYAFAMVAFTPLAPALLFSGAAGVQSSALAECVDGRLKLGGNSAIAHLYGLESEGVQVPPDGSPVIVPLEGVGTLYLNERIETETRVTMRALRLHTPLVDLVLAETSASLEGACPRQAGQSKARRPARSSASRRRDATSRHGPRRRS